MQSIKDAMADRAPRTIKKEKCDVCNQGTKMVFEINGEYKTFCKYCNDRQLVKSLDIPTSQEYRDKRDMGFILSFERITSDLKDATVNTYKYDDDYPSQKDARQLAANFILNFEGQESLVLSGVPGVGKSHLSYAINKAIRNKGYKTLFIKSTDLLDAIKETYNYHSDVTQEQIFKMIDGLDLFILDDLGGEYEKKNDSNAETWASDVLYKAVDMRLGKSLIVTTNYSERELIAKYGNVQGERIVSRMMENATPIRIEGADKRRKERF